MTGVHQNTHFYWIKRQPCSPSEVEHLHEFPLQFLDGHKAAKRIAEIAKAHAGIGNAVARHGSVPRAGWTEPGPHSRPER